MTEAQEQKFLFQWAGVARQKYPELELLFHVPNGGKREKREAASLRKEGVKAGVPDLVLPVARGEYFGLYIELKVGKNKPKEHQLKWIEDLKFQGYFVKVCYGWIEASEVIENYLEQPKTQVIKSIS
ncbi:VRR-NUC domain-containing protein [Clostridium sp. C2-6-12]|uniref:VRR-NUC domain-containing protein n=1 Tax=Clostridium sp. C2-6-12 TaxID=2698832 RepID=UPI001370926C|nr:VRR-NUC domain-containing protein [Clostridium sp. C2-6-12]